MRRCLWYVAHGVRVGRIDDPADESVFVFRPDRLPLALQGGDRIDPDDIIPDFEIAVQELFDALGVR